MTSPHRLVEKVRAFAGDRTPSLACGRAVLAVSGGGDSIAMTSLLIEAGIVRPEASIAAWFDHRLRGDAASAQDRMAVAALCARYGLPLAAGAWDAPRRSEAAARDARYRFLSDAARRHTIEVIATAHTADDQAETIVMRSMRGAGAWGMRGIPAERVAVAGGDVGGWTLEGGDAASPTGDEHAASAMTVARPVLACSRAELRAWCALRGLGYVDDPSNGDRRYLRNRVRHDVLPEMEAREPGARERMLALADAARVRVEALAREAADCARPPHPEIETAHAVLDRGALRVIGDDAAAHAFRLAVMSIAGDAREFGRRHYDTMVRAARGATGASYEMPRGIVLTVDAAAVIVSAGRIDPLPIAAEDAHPLPWRGLLGGWFVDVRCGDDAVTQCADGSSREDGMTGGVMVPVAGGAVLRGRRPGDRVRLPGGGTKKLQDVYVDAKVPRRERDAAPVIAVGGEVVWSAAVGRSWSWGNAEAVVRVRTRRVGRQDSVSDTTLRR